MTLNLIKLCVGCESLEDMMQHVARVKARRAASGLPDEYVHTTRMTPKRSADLLAGGSLYWVIRGNIQCRQRLLEIRPVTDANGVGRCELALETVLVPTYWQPKRAFQGWRYLKGNETPKDLAGGEPGLSAVPPELRLELAELGLL